MIIIETTKGPHMINERETIGCSFDKEKGEAVVTYNHEPREVVSFHDGVPYADIVEQARLYIHTLGGFEKFAEWGLIRPNTDL